jgi:hypothetical protein
MFSEVQSSSCPRMRAYITSARPPKKPRDRGTKSTNLHRAVLRQLSPTTSTQHAFIHHQEVLSEPNGDSATLQRDFIVLEVARNHNTFTGVLAASPVHLSLFGSLASMTTPPWLPRTSNSFALRQQSNLQRCCHQLSTKTSNGTPSGKLLDTTKVQSPTLHPAGKAHKSDTHFNAQQFINHFSNFHSCCHLPFILSIVYLDRQTWEDLQLLSPRRQRTAG